jgi:hypothetical protein
MIESTKGFIETVPLSLYFCTLQRGLSIPKLGHAYVYEFRALFAPLLKYMITAVKNDVQFFDRIPSCFVLILKVIAVRYAG